VIPLSTLLAATADRVPVTGADRWSLSACTGFRVVSGREHVGVVARVGYRSARAAPEFLLVRGGVLGLRTVVIDVEDVEAIDSRRGIVGVRPGYAATIVASGAGIRATLARRWRSAA
jgi:hypothetical protein